MVFFFGGAEMLAMVMTEAGSLGGAGQAGPPVAGPLRWPLATIWRAHSGCR